MKQPHQSIDHLDFLSPTRPKFSLTDSKSAQLLPSHFAFPPPPFVETRLLDYSPECPDERRPFALGCKLAAFPCRLPSQKPLILCYPAEANGTGRNVDGHSGNSGRKEAGSVQDSGYHSFESRHAISTGGEPGLHLIHDVRFSFWLVAIPASF